MTGDTAGSGCRMWMMPSYTDTPAPRENTRTATTKLQK